MTTKSVVSEEVSNLGYSVVKRQSGKFNRWMTHLVIGGVSKPLKEWCKIKGRPEKTVLRKIRDKKPLSELFVCKGWGGRPKEAVDAQIVSQQLSGWAVAKRSDT